MKYSIRDASFYSDGAVQIVNQAGVIMRDVWAGEDVQFVLSEMNSGEPVEVNELQHDVDELESFYFLRDKATREIEKREPVLYGQMVASGYSTLKTKSGNQMIACQDYGTILFQKHEKVGV